MFYVKCAMCQINRNLIINWWLTASLKRQRKRERNRRVSTEAISVPNSSAVASLLAWDVCKHALLMGLSMRRLWLLRHQAGTQYSAVEKTSAKIALRRVLQQPPSLMCLTSLKYNTCC